MAAKSAIGALLGLNEALTVGEVVKRTSPGASLSLPMFLQRPFMNRAQTPQGVDERGPWWKNSSCKSA